MTSPAARLRDIVERADRSLLALRDMLTPGQRWTGFILVVLALAVILVGAPDRTVLRRGSAAASVPAASDGRSSGSGVNADASPRPAADLAASPDVFGSGGSDADLRLPVGGAVGGDTSTTSDGGTASGPLRVTALLPDAGATGAGSEASVAETFLAGAPFDIAARASVADADACASLGGDRTLVLGPEAVPAPLLSCIVRSGATVLAFDAGGTRPGVLSTRRAEAQSLLVLASWSSRTDGVLDGPVGIAGAVRDRAWIEAVVPALRAEGLNVRSTAFVDTADEVTSAVRRFVGEGVRDVVLAAPAQIRQQWAAQHALLDRQAKFVVADAHDGVGRETYAPTFDGAVALTTLKPPWHARAHGETDQQRRCRERWEASAPARRLAAGDETRWVYAWCQHVALVETVLQEANRRSGSIADLVRPMRMASPLTADLGPTGDEGWGPDADAVVVWRSSCGCWTEQEPFGPRRRR